MSIYEEMKTEICNFAEYVENTNEQLAKKLIESTNNEIIVSKEQLSIVVATSLSEDVDMILKLDELQRQARYTNYIIRGMAEAVIEYKYLIKNEHLIAEFFGDKLTIPHEMSLKNNPIRGIFGINSQRYVGGRKSISEMAKEVNEKKSEKDLLSLYDIFAVLSEESHNSYFQGVLDILEAESFSGKLSETQALYICTIIGKFGDAYDKI